MRIHFARFLVNGDTRDDLAREYFSVYHPHDEGPPRLWERPLDQLIKVADLYTGRELRTSPVDDAQTELGGRRVAALVAEGRSVRDVAVSTGFRENYVRSLIQQVCKKRGVSGQVALARQVLAVAALPRG